jgi:hypothetical protein
MTEEVRDLGGVPADLAMAGGRDLGRDMLAPSGVDLSTADLAMVDLSTPNGLVDLGVASSDLAFSPPPNGTFATAAPLTAGMTVNGDVRGSARQHRHAQEPLPPGGERRNCLLFDHAASTRR